MLCSEGEIADSFYILHAGEIAGSHKIDGAPVQVTKWAASSLEPHPHIDQMTILQCIRRPNTVTVTSRTATVWKFSGRVLRHVLRHGKAPPPTQSKLLQLLRDVDVLESMGGAQPERFAKMLTETHHPEGQTILRQGDPADAFYILQAHLVAFGGIWWGLVGSDALGRRMHLLMKALMILELTAAGPRSALPDPFPFHQDVAKLTTCSAYRSPS